MARSFNNSTDNLVRTTNLVPLTFPFSSSIWFYHAGTGATDICFGSTDGADEYHIIYIASSNSALWRVQSDTQSTMANGGGRTQNQWQHISGSKLVGSNTDSKVFLDGSKNTSNSTLTAPPISQDNNRIGARDFLGVTDFFNGYLAEFAFWNVELDDEEHVALSKGFSPWFIRPQNLLRYVPIWGRHSPEIDLFGGFDFAVNGSPTQIDHPPIIYPEQDILIPSSGDLTIGTKFILPPFRPQVN